MRYMIFEVQELMDMTTAAHIGNSMDEDGTVPRQQMMLLMRKITEAEDKHDMTFISFFAQYAIFKKNI